jgi:hypothetical protein
LTFNNVFSTGKFVAAALLLIALQGCAGFDVPLGGNSADSIASGASLKREDVAVGPFTLTTYSRITDINAPITIYIEGDIQGWWPPTDPGVNPMPDDGLGLRLATIDPSPNVAYIARPCQFTSTNDPACNTEAWSHGRYAEQIVESMNRAVDHFAVPFTQPHLNLVGYSGGAAVAAIIASRRKDIQSLRTIAGNLDPNGVIRYHAADANQDFVDPMPIAKRLRLLPQIHYVGENDTTVPPFLAANFVAATGRSFCVKLIPVPGATHTTGWEQMWRDQAAVIPLCNVLSTF